MSTAEPAVAVLGRLGRAQFEQTARRAARRLGRARPDAMAVAAVAIPDTDVAFQAASDGEPLRATADQQLADGCSSRAPLVE